MASPTGAMAPLAPGPLVAIGRGRLRAEIAPEAGGRIAQIVCDGIEQLVGHDDGEPAAIAWGSYPMVPWAGRTHGGRFDFQDRSYRMPPNLGEHAIHGVGFVLPWRLDERSPSHVALSLALPDDARWPFGGIARQWIGIEGNRLAMRLSVTADRQAMPAVIGWHPWFRKPERIDFSPVAIHSRVGDGIAAFPQPLNEPPPGPWDDCFVNREPVLVHRAGQTLRLTSDCRHWVVYDEPEHATCVEPQSGPSDGLNLGPAVLSPGATLSAWFEIEWL